ncbi:putative membrane protein [Bradyrhizobium sp. USDA 4354]
MSLMASSDSSPQHRFDPAEMGAIAHLYRGEVYRSTIWRTRLDNTTNWAIVTMGIALSTTFSSPGASPLPLVLVGLLIAVFLAMEARRYRYFNVWRARARWLEKNFYAPMFTGEAHDNSWQAILARDYTAPRHHISFVRAAGRRLRRNYVWILVIQAVAYYGKIAIHPTPAANLAEFVDRAAVGPVPGGIVLIMGFAYDFGWLAFALGTLWLDQREHGAKSDGVAMG